MQCPTLNDHTMPIKFEIIIIAFHHSKRKCLKLRIYKFPIQNETEFLQKLSSVLAFCYPKHDHIIITGKPVYQ